MTSASTSIPSSSERNSSSGSAVVAILPASLEGIKPMDNDSISSPDSSELSSVFPSASLSSLPAELESSLSPLPHAAITEMNMTKANSKRKRLNLKFISSTSQV